MSIQQQARGTSAAWYDANPILASAEIGYIIYDDAVGADNTNAGKFKIGDGVTPWNDLPIASGDMGPIGPRGTYFVSSTPPPDPVVGDMWFNDTNAALSIYYDSYWVETTGQQGPTGATGPAPITSVSAPLSIAGPTSAQTISISDASETTSGVITTGTQTIAGAKTFSANTTYFTNGANTKGVQLWGDRGSIEIGRRDGTSWTPFIDFHTGADVDYNARIIASSGGSGLGNLQLEASSLNVTGSLNLRSGTSVAGTAPLYLQSGTNLSIPVYGAVESATDAIYITNNPGSTTTGPGRGIVTAPHMVFSLANSSGANSSTPINIFSTPNDVLSSLEPAKLYRFRAKYFVSFNFAGSQMPLNAIFNFSNAPTAIKWTYKSYSQAGGTTLTQLGASSSTSSNLVLGTGPTVTGSWVVEIDGYFTTHATLASTLTLQASTPATVSGPGYTFNPGSWFEVEKLGTSTQTLIAGNWI
jgi:hypothetical protein